MEFYKSKDDGKAVVICCQLPITGLQVATILFWFAGLYTIYSYQPYRTTFDETQSLAAAVVAPIATYFLLTGLLAWFCQSLTNPKTNCLGIFLKFMGQGVVITFLSLYVLLLVLNATNQEYNIAFLLLSAGLAVLATIKSRPLLFEEIFDRNEDKMEDYIDYNLWYEVPEIRQMRKSEATTTEKNKERLAELKTSGKHELTI